MELANKIVAELGIEHFFNIQLVGDYVIEINPRISTIVYQEDLNLPYLGVKRAIGEISDDELRALSSRIRPGRTALRYFDQLEWDALRGGTRRPGPRFPVISPSSPSLTPTHPRGNGRLDRVKGKIATSPCQLRDKFSAAAGHALPGQHRRDPLGERPGAAAQGTRLRGSSSSSAASFTRRPTGRSTATAASRTASSPSGSAFSRLLPRTDIFHFYFGLTLIPKSLQFPLLRAARRKSVFHFLGLGHPRQDARRARLRQTRRRPDRRLLRRDPLGARGARRPARPRPQPVHAAPAVRQPTAARRPRPVEPREEGHALRDRGLRAAARSSSTSSKASPTTRRASATRAPTSSSTS